jgi:AcrR family transcriptional regulator
VKNAEMKPQEHLLDNPGRQRIVSAARYHFFAYGFRSVTMDDLARELGMSKKTLYDHFPSKTALVEAVLVDKVRSVEDDLKSITADASSDFPGSVRRLLARLQEHLAEVQPPFLRDLRRDAPELFSIVETKRRDMVHQYFGKLVRDGQSAGIIREDLPTELIVEILLAAAQGIMNPEKLTDLGIAATRGFSVIISVILEGVLTERGRATL